MLDSSCIDCDKPCGEDFDRCYDCNQEHRNETVSVDFKTLLHETPKAFRLEIAHAEAAWYPKSFVEIDRTDNVMTLPRWLAEEKELDYDD